MVALAMTTSASLPDRVSDRPAFFAMAYGMRDWDPVTRVEWMAAQGYEGIAMHVWNEALFRDLEVTLATDAVRGGRFRVFGVYVPYDFDNPSHRALASAVIKAGAAADAPLWVTFKPIDTPAEQVVALVRELCDEAARVGTEVVLYPHDMTWCLDLADTLTLIRRVQRPNLFTSLHLHQELRAGNVDRIEAIIAESVEWIRLVSISGTGNPADVTPGSRDWSDVVRPLPDSVYPVRPFLEWLHEAGYRGPIGLQNWQLPGDPAERHREAIAWWRTHVPH